jgi:hypothetical protein
VKPVTIAQRERAERKEMNVFLVPSNLKLDVTSVSHAQLENSVLLLVSMETPKSTLTVPMVTGVKREIKLITLPSPQVDNVSLVLTVMLELDSLEIVIQVKPVPTLE